MPEQKVSSVQTMPQWMGNAIQKVGGSLAGGPQSDDRYINFGEFGFSIKNLHSLTVGM